MLKQKEYLKPSLENLCGQCGEEDLVFVNSEGNKQCGVCGFQEEEAS